MGAAAGKKIADYHLSFEPVNALELNLGTEISFNGVLLEFTGHYEQQSPESKELKRHYLLLDVRVSQFK
jgi:hypothetical protein